MRYKDNIAGNKFKYKHTKATVNKNGSVMTSASMLGTVRENENKILTSHHPRPRPSHPTSASSFFFFAFMSRPSTSVPRTEVFIYCAYGKTRTVTNHHNNGAQCKHFLSIPAFRWPRAMNFQHFVFCVCVRPSSNRLVFDKWHCRRLAAKRTPHTISKR